MVTNAAQAIGPCLGSITVALTPFNEGIKLTVTDSGAGMDQATLARIFEPFFTTKPVGEGTGLGLSVTHGVIARCGGRIDVKSTPGLRTVFTIVLPGADVRAGEMTVAA